MSRRPAPPAPAAVPNAAPTDAPHEAPTAALEFADLRAGSFFVFDGARVHESDLTPAQRDAVGLPPLEPALDAAPAAVTPAAE